MKTLTDYIKELEDLPADHLYDYILDIGANTNNNAVPRNESTFVPGCVSQVYVTGQLGVIGWEFEIDSDSYMVRGIGKIITECLSGLSTEELNNINWVDFQPLSKFFSQQRKQGMQAIINKCKLISRGR